MDTKDFGRNNGGDRKRVKHINERLPHLNVQATLAFVIKTIHTRHICTFVVSAEQEKVFRILDFVAKKKKNRF